MRWWAVGMLVVCDCDAGEPPHAKSAPSALETVDSSLALPARGPEPKGPRKDEAKRREVLASASLERFLELAADRFGDEHHGRRYAALPAPPNDGAELLEKWASEHLTWPAIARGRLLAGPPSTPGEIVCVASDRIRVFPSDAAPHIALLLFARGRDPIVGDPSRGFLLVAFGAIPARPERFCGVYTGDAVTDDGRQHKIVGMFDPG